jgi:hypothetical protein
MNPQLNFITFLTIIKPTNLQYPLKLYSFQILFFIIKSCISDTGAYCQRVGARLDPLPQELAGAQRVAGRTLPPRPQASPRGHRLPEAARLGKSEGTQVCVVGSAR